MLTSSVALLVIAITMMVMIAAIAVLDDLITVPIQAQVQQKMASEFVLETQAECGQLNVQPLDCVGLEYESPNTVVLHGDLLVFNATIAEGIMSGEQEVSSPYSINTFLWKVVDNLKASGFVIDSVVLAGQGTEPNPHVYHVIMSKQ